MYKLCYKYTWLVCIILYNIYITTLFCCLENYILWLWTFKTRKWAPELIKTLTGAGTAYPSRGLQFTPDFCFYLGGGGLCSVLFCLSACLLAIVFSVLPQIMTSEYSFDILYIQIFYQSFFFIFSQILLKQ